MGKVSSVLVIWFVGGWFFKWRVAGYKLRVTDLEDNIIRYYCQFLGFNISSST
jgi:hypothetical protein